MDYAGLRQLLCLAEDFERENGEEKGFDQQKFTTWLVSKAFGRGDGPQQGDDHSGQAGEPLRAGYIAMLLGFMGHYASFYARRVFRHSVIYSLDDFGVLISLHPNGRLTKTETLKRCRLEKSSGNEVLKRLLRQQLIQETAHPADRRSKVIELTAKGSEAFGQVWDSILNMSKLVTGDLSGEEQLLLLQLLSKLNRFHQPIFEQGKEEEIGKLLGLNP